MNHLINDIDDHQLPTLSINGISEISSEECFTEKDNAEIEQLKEQWSETWKNDSLCNLFLSYRKYTLDHDDQYDDLFASLDMCTSISQLSYREYMLYLKLNRFYLPIFKEAKEKTFYKKRIRTQMDLDSEFIRDSLKFEKKFEGQTVDLDECYLKDIDLSYDVANQVKKFDDVNVYLSFLKLWKSQEKREDLSPRLKLNMMVSNLKLIKQYIGKIKGDYAELLSEMEKVYSKIISSLTLFERLFVGKDDDQLAEELKKNDKLFNTIATRNSIKDCLCKYKELEEKKQVEMQKSLDEKVVASVATSEEKVDTTKISEMKPEQQESKQQVSKVEKVPTREEVLMMTKRNFEWLRERLASEKLSFDMLSEKHADFLSHAYLRVNKMGKVEEFAKKNEISEKIFELRGLFSELARFSVSDDLDEMQLMLERLRCSFSEIQSKLGILHTLLSTAENFMSKKISADKATCSSSGSESEKSDSSSEESSDVAKFVVKYRSSQAEEEYKSHISEGREKKFFEKFSKYLVGQANTDLEKITGVNYSFISCRYSLAGRICFTYDPDTHCIEIIGVTDDHDYEMIKRRLGL